MDKQWNDEIRISSIMSQPKQTPDEKMAHSDGGPPGYLAPAVALVSCISTSAFNRAKLALEKEPSSPTEIDAGQNASTAIATNGASPSGISNGVSPSPVTSSECVSCLIFFW